MSRRNRAVTRSDGGVGVGMHIHVKPSVPPVAWRTNGKLPPMSQENNTINITGDQLNRTRRIQKPIYFAILLTIFGPIYYRPPESTYIPIREIKQQKKAPQAAKKTVTKTAPAAKRHIFFPRTQTVRCSNYGCETSRTLLPADGSLRAILTKHVCRQRNISPLDFNPGTRTTICVWILSLYIPVDIQRNQCPCRFFILEKYKLCARKP